MSRVRQENALDQRSGADNNAPPANPSRTAITYRSGIMAVECAMPRGVSGHITNRATFQNTTHRQPTLLLDTRHTNLHSSREPGDRERNEPVTDHRPIPGAMR